MGPLRTFIYGPGESRDTEHGLRVGGWGGGRGRGGTLKREFEMSFSIRCTVSFTSLKT